MKPCLIRTIKFNRNHFVGQEEWVNDVRISHVNVEPMLSTKVALRVRFEFKK